MRFNIRLKFITFAFCIVLLVGGSIAFYSVYQGREEILATFENDARLGMSSLSAALAVHIYPLDVDALRGRLAAARANPRITYIYALDNEGSVLADDTRENPLRGRKLADSFAKKVVTSNRWLSEINGSGLRVGGPILTADKRKVGYLYIGFSLVDVERFVQETTRGQVYIAGICLGFGAVLAIILSLSFSRPISAILQASREIGGGKLDTRVAVTGSGELGALARSINKMAESLKARQGETEQRAREQEALNSIATATGQLLAPQELFKVALAKTVEVTGRHRINLRLKDARTGEVDIVAHLGFSEEEIEELRRRTPHQPTQQVFASGKSLVINGTQEDSSASFLKQTLCVAWIPVKTGAAVLGVLGISDNQSRPFSPGEVSFLQAIGNQIGVALENARLFEETKRRNEELRALYLIGSAVNRTLDTEALARVALATTIEVLRANAGRFYVWHGRRNALRLTAHQGIPEEEIGRIEYYAPGEGTIGRIYSENRPIIFSDITKDPLYQSTSRSKWAERAGFRSLGGVPITFKGRPIGVIYLYAKALGQFSSQDIALLSAIGDQIGIAIENARLYGETERRRREAEEMARVAQSLTATLDIRAAGERIVTSVRELFGVKTSTLRLLQPDGSLQTIASAGESYSRTPVGGALPAGAGLMSVAIEEERAVWSADVLNEPKIHLTDQMREFQLQSGDSSIIAVPLRAHGKVIGSLGLADRTGRSYSDGEVALVQTFADQAALALEKARLFEETERRVQEQAALNAIALATSQSLRLEELLQVALDKVLEVTGRERGYIRLKDPVTGKLRLAAHQGISKEYIEVLLHRRTPGGKSDQVIESGEVLVINDSEAISLKDETRREGRRCLIWVPLKVRGKVVGLLNVSTNQPVPFNPREVELLKAIGNVIGVALENARLFEDTNRNLKGIRALHEIDKAITSTLDLHDVLNVLLEKIDLFLPYSTATIRLFSKQSGLLEPVACRNLDDAEWKASAWRPGRGPANVVFGAKAPLTIRNCLDDPRIKDPDFFRKHKLVSYLGVPLFAQEEILGVLSFYTREEHDFTAEEIDFLTTLAGQAAVAIRNSELYEEMTKLASDLSRANRVKDEFLSVMSHELRTPLNVVMGYTGMMRDGLLGPINAEQERALEKVISRARDQLTMISSILQATQIEAGLTKVQKRDIGLKDFLDDVKSGYSIPLGKELSLVWDYPSDLPVIHTDDEKLKQILHNLINNAIKFTDKGRVTVSAGIRQQVRGNGQQKPVDSAPSSPQRNGRCVEFKVADTGIGITKDNLSLIFERFRQVDSSETRSHGGVGIGLYVVEKFAALLGGKVGVQSEPGKGSTFTVTLPVDDAEA